MIKCLMFSLLFFVFVQNEHQTQLDNLIDEHKQQHDDSALMLERLEADHDRSVHEAEEERLARENLADDLRCVAEERASLAVQNARLEQQVAELTQDRHSGWRSSMPSEEEEEVVGLRAQHSQLLHEHSMLKSNFEQVRALVCMAQGNLCLQNHTHQTINSVRRLALWRGSRMPTNTDHSILFTYRRMSYALVAQGNS